MIFEQNFSYLSGMLKSSWTPQTKFHFPPVFWADSRKKKVSKSRQITSAWMESTTGKWENAPWTDPRNVLHEWKLLLARWNQCFCWYVYLSKPPLQLKSYGNPPVFCQRLFALQLPPFSQKFRRKRLSFPGSLNKSILLFWLSTKREREREEKKKKKSTSNICYTCPSSLNCGIHEFLNRLCFPLSRKKHERANSSAKHQLQHQLFRALRLCQDWETYDGIAIVINVV